MEAVVKTVASMIAYGESRLREIAADSARWEAETLLRHAAGWSRVQLYQNLQEFLPQDFTDIYEALLAQRIQRRPLQYIVGSQNFMGLSFHVDERVLIPRPETELLVERVLFFLHGRRNPTVLDLGTGSGAIAVSVAVFHPDAVVSAVDISEGALDVAHKNAVRHSVQNRIRFVREDMLGSLDTISSGIQFDGVVSNPPYIDDSAMKQLAPEIAEHEPQAALRGGADGLRFYRAIIPRAQKLLKTGGFLALEIGWDQGESVAALIQKTGGFRHIEICKDCAEHDRVVSAIKA